MNAETLKSEMVKLLPDRVVFSNIPFTGAIRKAIEAVQEGANLETEADRLSESLGWEGTPTFWMLLEGARK